MNLLHGVWWVLVLWFFLVIAGAMAVVTVRHQNRLQFVELQAVEERGNTLKTEWGRLILEKETWRMQNSIVEDAHRHLGMTAPPSGEIISLYLEKHSLEN